MCSIIYGNQWLKLNVENNLVRDLPAAIQRRTGLHPTEYYFTQNGRRIQSDLNSVRSDVPLRICERLPGGKGGFGSMLRAIGAQIEKTTNREACRDLSGRRLRDINEEKRLKAYLEKQQEADEDERVKAERKIAKLLAKPKHEFEDKEYEHTRSELVVLADEAIQEGLQKAIAGEEQRVNATASAKPGASKRKQPETSTGNAKRNKKSNLWLGSDDLSSSTETDDDSSQEDDKSSDSGLAVATKGNEQLKAQIKS
ncbi:splicing regulator SDE2-like [Anopheles nili]|uniref:splicing regulator SDE2-like n=1 Tax=Anopheles nili TaxID=185578 RepID=UPI00237A7D0C|nr:splicing regulator SDE2-like [Anopheles nili]